MTKTQMRKAVGINTNILAKIRKDKRVAMNTLAKMAMVLECGRDDIIERNTDTEKGGKE